MRQIENFTLFPSVASKSFVMGGEKPSEIDAVLFAFVACLVYTSAADDMFKTLVEKRLTNLNQHMLRMKNRYSVLLRVAHWPIG